jgi:hypothetical protein
MAQANHQYQVIMQLNHPMELMELNQHHPM